LLDYFLRCPFSRARMIEVTEQGKVLYKTEHKRPGRFPEAASEDLVTGSKRNFQVFDPLDFLADEAWLTGRRLQFLVQIFDRFSRPDHTALCFAEVDALFEYSRLGR
jgi:hypothetical protein